MRSMICIAAASLLMLGAPAFAQSVSAPNGSPAGSGSNPPGSGVVPNKFYAHHSTMRPMMRPQRNAGLGSVRHPTVGNTANQRTNGG